METMVYVFCGENSYEIQQRINELADGFDGEVEKIDGSELTLEQLPDLLTGVTLFSSARLIVIKGASQNKPIWTALGEWFERGIDTNVILVETSLDKRLKTYKWLEKHAKMTMCKELRAPEAEQWVKQAAAQRSVSMPASLIRFFVDYVGTDQWRLESELNKLQLSGEVPTEAVIKAIVEPTPQATAFELLDAAFRGQQAVFDELFSAVSRREEPHLFFGLLAGQVYAIAAVHFAKGKSTEVVAKDNSLHPFVTQKVAPLARKLTAADIKDMTSRLAGLDANLKSRSVEPWTQIRSFLTSLYL